MPLGTLRKPACTVSTARRDGDFAALLSADAIGQGEEPTLRLDLRGRGGEDVAEEVLVVIARETGIG